MCFFPIKIEVRVLGFRSRSSCEAARPLARCRVGAVWAGCWLGLPTEPVLRLSQSMSSNRPGTLKQHGSCNEPQTTGGTQCLVAQPRDAFRSCGQPRKRISKSLVSADLSVQTLRSRQEILEQTGLETISINPAERRCCNPMHPLAGFVESNCCGSLKVST